MRYSAVYGMAFRCALDLALNLRRSPRRAVSLVLQNLTSSRHAEMFAMWAGAMEVERSWYLKVTWLH